jgi:hypothetical protein
VARTGSGRNPEAEGGPRPPPGPRPRHPASSGELLDVEFADDAGPPVDDPDELAEYMHDADVPPRKR